MKKNKFDKTTLIILGILAAVTLLTIISVAASQKQGGVSLPGKAAEVGMATPTPVCWLKTMAPTPTLTPTPISSVTPTPGGPIVIQGRIYLDNDSQLNGRGGVSGSPIGPGAFEEKSPWNAFWGCGNGGPLTMDLATWGTGSNMSYGLQNVNNNPNFTDVCGSQVVVERQNTGVINGGDVHSSLAGGFSLRIDPAEAAVMTINNIRYYLVRAHIPYPGCTRTMEDDSILTFGDWLFTEVFWADTTPAVVPPNPVPTTYSSPTLESGAVNPYYGLRCDYNWRHGSTPGQLLPNPTVVCNVCFGGDTSLRKDSALTCNMTADGVLQESNNCLLENYKAAHYAGILVPVSGPAVRNLWIGVNKAEIVAGWPVDQGTQATQAVPQTQTPRESFWMRFLRIIGF